ncbi:hypothetical protein C8F01DRAFT_1140810 [Mycena amicta]|nr:hypothetical protein C8F01DRAFT_1140810 [Mycena amicta]
MHRVPSIHITSSLSLPLPRMSVSHPIHTLPAELLSHIFVLCLPRTQNATGLRHVSRHRAPLLLTRVCGLWRAVALGTPELWSELFIQPSPHVEMLEFWLGHGAEHPLSLYLHYRQPMAGMGMGMLSLLTASAGRWRDVDLFLHPSTLDTLASEYGSGQERRLPRQLPHLRRLSLGLIPAADANPRPITLFSNAPLLTEVTLIKIPPVPERVDLPWAQLTVLSVQCGSVDALIRRVLRLAPALRRLRMQIERPSGVAEIYQEDTDHVVVHPALESLSIHVHPDALETVPIRMLLSGLALPSLKTMVLPTFTAMDVPGVVAFAKRGDSKKLERLTLTGPPATLCRVLEAFGGGLRVLELRDVAHGALCALLEGLALAGGFDLLPDLESLHIDAFHSAHGIPYALLLDALQVRAGRLASFTMSVTSVSKAEGKEEEEYLPELARLKDQGMTIRMEYMCGGSVV